MTPCTSSAWSPSPMRAAGTGTDPNAPSGNSSNGTDRAPAVVLRRVWGTAAVETHRDRLSYPRCTVRATSLAQRKRRAAMTMAIIAGLLLLAAVLLPHHDDQPAWNAITESS